MKEFLRVLMISAICLMVQCLFHAGCIAQPGRTVYEMEEERKEMVRQQIERRGIKDEKVLEAMRKVPRHLFMPEQNRSRAHMDCPVSIGYGQTISQPYIVAYMTEQLKLKSGEKVLEIGTGSGYQAAILAECGAEVYSIEIIPELARQARKTLDAQDYDGIKTMEGDGYKGWPEHAPFDAVIVTCAPEDIPQALVDQLKDGGRMNLPVGGGDVQRLVIVRKKDGKTSVESDLPVRFVPMVKGKGNDAGPTHDKRDQE